jgi:SAM-dependent methyltransferase
VVSPDSSERGRPDRYDRIGVGYAARRRPDPRWMAQVAAAVGAGATVVNVGAGTGNYEPPDRLVIAVEPSRAMIAQRPPSSAPVIRGVAEQLPFPDGSFDVATALLTVHHWQDPVHGLAEMRRVSRRQVLSVFEPLVAHRFWLLEYFPEVRDAPAERHPPTPEWVARHLDVVDVQVLAIPHDFVDGVAAAHWRRPHEYLRPGVQAAVSSLALVSPEARARGAERLRADLVSGRWDQRWGHLLTETEADYGYRLVIAESH